MCVGRVCNVVLETQETREKTPTRKFGSGSGRVSLNKISGFSGQKLENPKNSGRVGFRGFSGFCTLYVGLWENQSRYRRSKELWILTFFMKVNLTLGRMCRPKIWAGITGRYKMLGLNILHLTVLQCQAGLSVKFRIRYFLSFIY